MERFEIIKFIAEIISDEPIICNIGHPSQELFAANDRPQNFYMLGSMGLASSIALGIAMSCREKPVICIEGDGAVLMNLGSLTTIGINQPKNLILIIIDNEAYGSTGFQDTFTGKGIHLNDIAKASGIKKSKLINNLEDLKQELKDSIKSPDGPYCFVIKSNKTVYEGIKIIPHDSITIKNRFMGSLNYENAD